MVSATLDPDVRDVGEWITICESLPPVQIFGLLGLLADNPDLPPSLARARETETPENMQAAKRWMKRNFRTIMQYYCGQRSVFEAAEGILDEAEFVKNLSFIIFGVLKVKIGVIVAAVYVVLKLKGDKWCDKYAGMTLAGEGPYRGNFPEGAVNAFFEITYLPPVVEQVENPAAYPLKVPMPVIEVDKEIKGRVKVPTKRQAETIFSSFQGGGVTHTFTFNDVTSRQDVAGSLREAALGPDAGLGVLDFTDADLTVGSKRL